MRIRLRGILFFLIFSTVLTSILPAQAHISWLEGSASIFREGNSLSAVIGGEVFEGDLVTTGPDSLVIIEMENRGDLKLRADTSIRLEHLTGEISVEMFRGGLFSKIRHLVGGGRNYRVHADNAVAAVRGTEFFMAYGRSVEDDPDLWLCVNDGAVEVAIQNSADSVLVNEGEGINILGGSRITDPKPYAWTKDLNWNVDPSAGDVKDTVDLNEAYSDLRLFDYD